MTYRVRVTDSARADLEYFAVHDQRIIVAGMLTHLTVNAGKETRKKKRLQPNPVAPFELRIDRFRIFYSIEAEKIVKILAVGQKEHSDLYLRGRKVEL